MARAVRAAEDASFSMYAVSPQALLAMYRRRQGQDPPPATLLAIPGERHALGEAPAAALANLEAALGWASSWLGSVD